MLDVDAVEEAELSHFLRCGSFKDVTEDIFP
jgi:hypothetical protein